MFRSLIFQRALFLLLIASAFIAGCAKKTCGALSDTDLAVIQSHRYQFNRPGSARGNLVVPNPFVAATQTNLQGAQATLQALTSAYSLTSLFNPSQLENGFIKIRPHSIQDGYSDMAHPDSNGNYAFDFSDVHYSETMGWFSVTNILEYVESLGFSLVKTRPLYVLVEGVDPRGGTGVNAYYTHNAFNPSAPRTINLFGNTTYAPGKDSEVYWHEFGHFVNESVSAERGIDLAGDMGAAYSEAAALHECLADYLAESFSGKPGIGAWLAPNFQGFSPGQPLRSAVDTNGRRQQFGEVGQYNNSQGAPDKYPVGEWCTRVLWDLRSAFVNQYGVNGAIYSDRLVFSALSLLQRDTSFREFRNSLKAADETLHCGQHSDAITQTFFQRGFGDPVAFSQPMGINATAQLERYNDGTLLTFRVRISNPNGVTAQNVRLKIEATSAGIRPLTYQQAYGDMPPGASLTVGESSGLTSEFSVSAIVNLGVAQAGYRLSLLTDNAAPILLQGQVNP